MHKRVSARRARALAGALAKSARTGKRTARNTALDSGLTRNAKPAFKRVVFYDLETSIVSKARKHEPFCTNIKGMKRRNLIVEIGAVDANVPDATPYSSTFHRLVDPRIHNMTLAQTLELTNQNVQRTLMYWNKLFSQKKMIQKQSKSTPVDEQLTVFEELFDRPEFVSTRRALSQFIAFCLGKQQVPSTPILVAHGGKSFDHQIVRAFCHRLNLPQFGNYMVDSLPVARRIMPRMKSHSLGNLHNKVIGTDFDFAHHAMADAHALFRVCSALAEKEGLQHVSDLWSDKAADLTHIRGIGPQTSKHLRGAGYDTATLRACVLANEICPQKLKKLIRNHKSLWKGLRKKWATPAALQEEVLVASQEVPTPRATPTLQKSTRKSRKKYFWKSTCKCKWDKAAGQSFIVRPKPRKSRRSKSI